MTFHQKLAGAVLAVTFLTSATAADAEVLILRSVGPSANKYPAGQRLPDNARLVLRPGDAVSVLRPSGTRVFRGPGSYTLDAGPAQTTSETRGARVMAGVVRGDGGPASASSWPSDLWHVNAAESGTACFVAGSPVVLWRRDSNRKARVSVTSPAGTTTRLDWPARADTLMLPATVGADRSRISYTPAGSSREARVTLAELKIDTANRELVGSALLDRRCHIQLQHFIALNDEGVG